MPVFKGPFQNENSGLSQEIYPLMKRQTAATDLMYCVQNIAEILNHQTAQLESIVVVFDVDRMVQTSVASKTTFGESHIFTDHVKETHDVGKQGYFEMRFVIFV